MTIRSSCLTLAGRQLLDIGPGSLRTLAYLAGQCEAEQYLSPIPARPRCLPFTIRTGDHLSEFVGDFCAPTGLISNTDG